MTRTIMIRLCMLLSVVISGVLGMLIGTVAPPLGFSAATVAPQAALGSGFTYQGYVTQNGTPLNGAQACDGQFELWDAASGGSQLGGTQVVTNIDFTGGYFTVTLNGANEFGTAPFAGAARWLAIAMRCPAGTGAFTPLGRQALTAAPYATYAGNGVPSGTLILSESPSPPDGYTYTDQQIGNDWTTKATMPTARYGLGVATVNNKIYAIGGNSISTYLATVEEYNPTTNAWVTRASMPTTREYLATAMVNNKVYAIGGYNGSISLTTMEEYDPTTNTWMTRASMPTARHALAAAAVNGKIYAIGGRNGGSLTTVEEYDPTTNIWTTKAALPTARFGLIIATVNNKIYAIGGYNGTTYLTVVEEFDPTTNTWATKAPMPTAHGFLAAVVLNGAIYTIGGQDGTWLTTVEEYEPTINAWTTRASIPTARASLATAVINNKIYAIGGYNGSTALSNVESYQPITLYLHRKN